MNTISSNDKNCSQSIRAYDDILRNWKKRQDIEEACAKNESLKIFVDSLGAIASDQAEDLVAK